MFHRADYAIGRGESTSDERQQNAHQFVTKTDIQKAYLWRIGAGGVSKKNRTASRENVLRTPPSVFESRIRLAETFKPD